MVGKLSDIQNHADLLGVLKTLRVAAVYDLFGQTLLHNFFKDIAVGSADAASLIAALPEGNMSLEEFIDRLDAQALVETKRNANRALTRNLFRESFRITEAYCRSSSQLDDLKAQAWFQFARIVANCLSHSFRLEFRPHDISQLPVSYAGVSIDQSFDGQAIVINLETLISLVDELIAFAKGIR